MKKKDTAQRRKPRLPGECRDRLRHGGAHKNKKKYKREKNHQCIRDECPDAFL